MEVGKGTGNVGGEDGEGEGRFDAAFCGNTGYVVLTGLKIYSDAAFEVIIRRLNSQ